MWSTKAKLAEKAHEIAQKKYPNGYNKKQLIECSHEVYNGFGRTQIEGSLATKGIKTMEDVNNMGNAMAQIDGHYPVGMSGCYVVGLNGGCGFKCPVYLEGDCDEPQEFEGFFETKEQSELHRELYGIKEQTNEPTYPPGRAVPN